MKNSSCKLLKLIIVLCILLVTNQLAALELRTVSREHPRLFGNAATLKALALQRPQEYQLMKAVATNPKNSEYARMMSISLVNAIEPNAELARTAVDLAMKRINAPIVTGHARFANVLVECAVVFDYCYAQWTPEEREKFYDYFNRTVAANVNVERGVFHNAWYSYKNWGYGIAAYATYYENPESPKLLKEIEQEFIERAAPALELSGEGGGFAEGYYVNYWIYEWTVFCQVALNCEGVDYFAMAPKFFKYRAVAGMFEAYPGIPESGSRRPVPMGDGGGRVISSDRDKTFNARRILTSYYRDDPAHQAVFSFNEITPSVCMGEYAYKDFLWHDTSIPKGDLSKFKLSHYSPGAGYVYARSSWDEDATYFFFKCGNRFTAHQHLDVGHFLIYKGGELIGDGGHYNEFGGDHDVNYHLRTVAHTTMRVVDPDESWEVPGRTSIRAGNVTANDGGQHFNFPHHNGDLSDVTQWIARQQFHEIGQILTFEEKGDHIFIKADCTKSYSPKKMEKFIRQIVFLRPGTFIIVDSVRITNPSFKTIWNLQAMKQPVKTSNELWTWSNGSGRLFLQTLLPEKTDVTLYYGDNLYTINGVSYPPEKDTGPAPECRMEITPSVGQKDYLFVHVLQATDAGVTQVPLAKVNVSGNKVSVTVDSKHTFDF